MSVPLDKPLAFVDLETTGATATIDRVTEVAIITWDGERSTSWSQLLNPETRIPAFIESLTGITNEMVQTAPRFADVADEIAERLAGHIFVAHNARFDYAFLKNEFKRLGMDFRYPTLCTVKYSRRLYPQHHKHSLATLIERHGLAVEARHRALADTQAIFDFWRLVERAFPAERLYAVQRELLARPSLPAHIDPNLVDELPDGHGVYLFYGENDLPIYVGKSKNLRKRVLSHFSSDHADAKEMKIAQQVRRIEWRECAGEIHSLLTEARLIKELQPTLNRQLRRNRDLCSWALVDQGDGSLKPQLMYARDLEVGRQQHIYGLFKNAREAQKVLSELVSDNQLCLTTLGLEQGAANKPCFARQLKRCAGACVGEESLAAHSKRLEQVLVKFKLQAWEFDGPAYLREGDVIHVIDNWCHLGTCSDAAGVEEILAAGKPIFDRDAYKILVRQSARIVLSL